MIRSDHAAPNSKLPFLSPSSSPAAGRRLASNNSTNTNSKARIRDDNGGGAGVHLDTVGSPAPVSLGTRA